MTPSRLISLLLALVAGLSGVVALLLHPQERAPAPPEAASRTTRLQGQTTISVSTAHGRVAARESPAGRLNSTGDDTPDRAGVVPAADPSKTREALLALLGGDDSDDAAASKSRSELGRLLRTSPDIAIAALSLVGSSSLGAGQFQTVRAAFERAFYREMSNTPPGPGCMAAIRWIAERGPVLADAQARECIAHILCGCGITSDSADGEQIDALVRWAKSDPDDEVKATVMNSLLNVVDHESVTTLLLETSHSSLPSPARSMADSDLGFVAQSTDKRAGEAMDWMVQVGLDPKEDPSRRYLMLQGLFTMLGNPTSAQHALGPLVGGRERYLPYVPSWVQTARDRNEKEYLRTQAIEILGRIDVTIGMDVAIDVFRSGPSTEMRREVLWRLAEKFPRSSRLADLFHEILLHPESDEQRQVAFNGLKRHGDERTIGLLQGMVNEPGSTGREALITMAQVEERLRHDREEEMRSQK